jgi:hypothetical protein
MKKEIIASIRIRFDARFLSGARPFLMRSPGEAVFSFSNLSAYDADARRIGPRHPNCMSGTKMQASAAMEGPLRANLHEWGPFQIGVSMTERRFPPPWSSIPLRGVKLRQDSCPLKSVMQ